MGRYLLKFSYIGTYYRGMQKQLSQVNLIDDDCIQGALESALLTVKPKSLVRPVLVLSSRTDAGVHALCNAAHVDLENKYNSTYKPEVILRYVNSYMANCSHNIRLLDCIPVTDNFHARFNAKSRTYIYRFMVPKNYGENRIPIIELPHCHLIRDYAFDAEKVKHATRLFLGVRDFRTFVSKNSQSRNFVRQLNFLTMERGEPLMPYDPLTKNFDFWHLIFNSRSFLHNQIRRIVGTLIALGRGKLSEKDINVMLQVPSTHNWNPVARTAPPHGLFLSNVEYDSDVLDSLTIKWKNESAPGVVESVCTLDE